MTFDYPRAPGALREALVLAARAHDEAMLAEHFHILLMEGGLKRVRAIVDARPELLAALLPLVANPEASMNVRLGTSAIIEAHAGTPALAGLVERLGELSAHEDHRVRADACHFLGLTGSARAAPFLQARREDADAEVREIAAEALAELPAREAA